MQKFIVDDNYSQVIQLLETNNHNTLQDIQIIQNYWRNHPILENLSLKTYLQQRTNHSLFLQNYHHLFDKFRAPYMQLLQISPQILADYFELLESIRFYPRTSRRFGSTPTHLIIMRSILQYYWDIQVTNDEYRPVYDFLDRYVLQNNYNKQQKYLSIISYLSKLLVFAVLHHQIEIVASIAKMSPNVIFAYTQKLRLIKNDQTNLPVFYMSLLFLAVHHHYGTNIHELMEIIPMSIYQVYQQFDADSDNVHALSIYEESVYKRWLLVEISQQLWPYISKDNHSLFVEYLDETRKIEFFNQLILEALLSLNLELTDKLITIPIQQLMQYLQISEEQIHQNKPKSNTSQICKTTIIAIIDHQYSQNHLNNVHANCIQLYENLLGGFNYNLG